MILISSTIIRITESIFELSEHETDLYVVVNYGSVTRALLFFAGAFLSGHSLGGPGVLVVRDYGHVCTASKQLNRR